MFFFFPLLLACVPAFLLSFFIIASLFPFLLACFLACFLRVLVWWFLLIDFFRFMFNFLLHPFEALSGLLRASHGPQLGCQRPSKKSKTSYAVLLSLFRVSHPEVSIRDQPE